MGTYRYEGKEGFAKWKGLEFFINFIRNHDEDIYDDDVFKILRDVIIWEDALPPFRRTFDQEELQKIKLRGNSKEDDRLDPASFNFNIVDMFYNAWQRLPRKTVKDILVQLLEKAMCMKPSDDSDMKDILQQRLEELQVTLCLSDLERDILLVHYLVRAHVLETPEPERILSAIQKLIFVAKCLNCNVNEVRKAMSDSEKLRRFGCISEDIRLNNSLVGFFDGTDDTPLESRYFKKYQDETLPWEFFGKLASEHGAVLKNMIVARKLEHGLNILLYGAPGTGKTSFARSLARELELDCYDIVRTDREKEESKIDPKMARLAALQISDMKVDRTRSLLVVDEADDLLSWNKGQFNTVLDTIKTPTVWITNTPARAIDESSRRRFDYSIHFEKLTSAQRTTIWKNSVRLHKVDALFDDDALAEFARRYQTSAGGIALALRNVANFAPTKEDAPAMIAKLMEPHCELLGIKPDDSLMPAKDYSLEGLNMKSGVPLAHIVEAIRRFQTEAPSAPPDRPRMNILLHGAPGTGKTEFVKFLGKTLDTKVIVKMGSDLLSMWVGGTEQNITDAFRQAKAENAILFLDEIDGLMQSREGAQRSWEVTQVNELLQQMENFGGVLIAATNFSDNLDPASLRRFTFKLEFAHLDDASKKHFFGRMFGVPLTSGEAARLEKIPDLSPGDFRTVRQSLYYLGENTTNADRLDALERESLAKGHTRYSSTRRRIGF